MALRVDRGIGGGDGPLAVDHVGDSIGGRLVRIHGRVVGQADFPIRITQERKTEVELSIERPVFLDRIETDPQDRCILSLEFLDSVPESLSFDGSPRGVSFGVKPKDDSLSRKVGELQSLSGVCLGGELWRLLADA